MVVSGRIRLLTLATATMRPHLMVAGVKPWTPAPTVASMAAPGGMGRIGAPTVVWDTARAGGATLRAPGGIGRQSALTVPRRAEMG